MTNNLTIKDGLGANKVIHTVEDSTSAHYNMSIPINTSGVLMFDVVPGNVSITNTLPIPVSITGGSLTATIADNAPVSVRGGVLGAVSLGGGTANIGTVSISPTQANIPVSLAPITFNLPVSIAGTPTVNAAQSGTWTVQPGNTANTTPWLVSVNGTPAVSVAAGRVSVAGMVTVEPKSNTGSAVPAGAFYVGGTDGTNLRGFLTDTAGALVITSIKDDVSIAPQTLLVHVCNALPAAGATQLVSIGGAVSLQAVQIAGKDTAGNARTPLMFTDGTLLVHVCNALPAAGATQLVSIGGAVSLQAVQIAGRDINGDARTPRLHTDGSVIVHVCNAQAAPSSDVSISPTQGNIPVSVAPLAFNMPVSVHPVTQSGTWTVQPGNTANTTPWLVSVGGNVSITDNAPVSVRGGNINAAQSGTWNVGVNAGTALIGAVSIRQIVSVVPDGTGANFPVSIAGTPSFNAIQSGTWTVQPGNTANTTPWLVSVGGNVSLTDNAPVSVRGGVLGAVSLGGGTALIGSVSISPNGLNIPVSIGGGSLSATIADNAPVSVRGGRVSIADSTLAVTQSGTWTVQPGNTQNTAPWLVSEVPTSTDGLTVSSIVVSAFTSGYLTKGAAGKVYSIQGFNNAATPLYLRMFNAATARPASDTPYLRFIIPGNTAGAGFVISFPTGITFGTGIGWRISGGVAEADTTAPADNQGYVNILYK